MAAALLTCNKHLSWELGQSGPCSTHHLRSLRSCKDTAQVLQEMWLIAVAGWAPPFRTDDGAQLLTALLSCCAYVTMGYALGLTMGPSQRTAEVLLKDLC